MPGSPPIKITEPGTKPPPNTRSSSASPVPVLSSVAVLISSTLLGLLRRWVPVLDFQVGEVLDKLKTEMVPDQELQKVKNQAKANAYRRLSNGTFIMFQLLQNEGTGDWKKINTQSEDVDAVSAADIQRVAKQYITKETRAVGVFTRKAADPAAVELEKEGKK